MVESKLKPYGAFSLVFTAILFALILTAIYTLISVTLFDGQIIPRGTLSPSGAVIFSFFFVLLLIIILRGWISFPFRFLIDRDNKVLTSKSLFGLISKRYTFSHFDSYIDTSVTTIKGDNYKVIYLIKNKRAELIISGFYIENVDEIRQSIMEIRYLGFQQDYALLSRKALFNRPIIPNA